MGRWGSCGVGGRGAVVRWMEDHWTFPHRGIPRGSDLPELGAAPEPGFPEGACVRARAWLGPSTGWLLDRKSASLRPLSHHLGLS